MKRCICLNKYFFYFDILFKKKDSDNRLDRLLNNIKLFKSLFIISSADKTDNNFGEVFKLLYKNLLLEEYLGNNTISRLTSPHTQNENRLNMFVKKLYFRFSNFIFPYLPINSKFH